MENVLGEVVQVHPVALFTIVDSYERRPELSKRVIGTLMGGRQKGIVEIRSCYAVPHNETDEEVAVDMDFDKQMLELHRKVNKSEIKVGWFSTFSFSDRPKYGTAPENMMHSVLIHDYYSRSYASPIFLTVDTTLRAGRLEVKAFVKSKVGLPNKTAGVIFTPVPCEVVYFAPERIGVQLLSETVGSGKTPVKADFEHLQSAAKSVDDLLTKLVGYTKDVMTGKTQGDGVVGRLLMETISRVPKIEGPKFESLLNSTMQDLLMVVYLADLTKTQMVLGERLSQFKST